MPSRNLPGPRRVGEGDTRPSSRVGYSLVFLASVGEDRMRKQRDKVVAEITLKHLLEIAKDSGVDPTQG